MFDWYALSYFHFLRPWVLLLMLPFAGVLYYLWRLNDPLDKWHSVIAKHLLQSMLIRGGRGHWFNPVSVGAVVVLLAIIALAGPSWERASSPFVEDEAALVIALDLSATMDQEDVQPSRLERAQQKIEDLLALRGGARTALLVYAGSAHSVVPLTSDLDIIRNFLAALVTEMMPGASRKKVPEKVLPLAAQMLNETGLPGTLLLIGDGIGPDSAAAFEAFFNQPGPNGRHQLLILGVGQNPDDEKETDQGLERQYLPFDRQSLQRLANVSGGSYVDLSLDKTDVAGINRRTVNHLMTVEDDSRPWLDAGYYLLYPFALLYLLWFRKGWTLHWVLAGCALSLSLASPNTRAEEFRFANLWLTPDQQGRYYFEKGDYITAAERFDSLVWKGVAYYYAENFVASVELFAQIETADGFFNLGNAWAQSQQYLYAVESYRRALQLQPNHVGALKNRAKIQAIIDEINRMSESQQAEPGERSEELGDAPRRADGAEREQIDEQAIKQYTAAEILTDKRIQALWMRQVQPNPSRFLRAKFQMQLNALQSASEDTPSEPEEAPL